MKQILTSLLSFCLCICLVSCVKEKSKTKLVYFGFSDRSEKSDDEIHLAHIWGENSVCPHWRSTIKKDDADYQVLFGEPGSTEEVTIIDRRGGVLYSGGPGVLYMPHGNPDGSGVNVCKLTGE